MISNRNIARFEGKFKGRSGKVRGARKIRLTTGPKSRSKSWIVTESDSVDMRRGMEY